MEEKIMENIKLEEIIEVLMEKEVQRIRFDEDKKEFIFNLSQFNRFFNEYKDVLTFNKNKKDEYMYLVINKNDSKDKIRIRIQVQNHETKLNDIKIQTIKKSDFSLKLIYHIGKSRLKEYRIFLSFYDENNRLKRFRIKTDRMEKIKDKEDESIKYLEQLAGMSLDELKKII